VHFFDLVYRIVVLLSEISNYTSCVYLFFIVIYFRAIYVNSFRRCLYVSASEWTYACYTVNTRSAFCRYVCTVTAAVLYRRLKCYLLTEEQLMENGFPRSHALVAGTAIVSIPQQEKSTVVLPSPNCKCSASPAWL